MTNVIASKWRRYIKVDERIESLLFQWKIFPVLSYLLSSYTYYNFNEVNSQGLMFEGFICVWHWVYVIKWHLMDLTISKYFFTYMHNFQRRILLLHSIISFKRENLQSIASTKTVMNKEHTRRHRIITNRLESWIRFLKLQIRRMWLAKTRIGLFAASECTFSI